MSVYAFDIDGTIANNEHRQWCLDDPYQFVEKNGKRHINWELFFSLMADDLPIWHMHVLATDLATNDQNGVIYFTGRPERWRDLTTQWLAKHGFPKGPMYMRANGDHRPDEIVKRELYETYLENADNEQPICVFDDRNKVVAMWRALGVPCMHVTDKGDF